MTVAEGAPGGEVTVGLDIGTTSVKGVAVDAEGTVLARARVPHEVRTGADGTFEHDVDAAWRTGILDALGQVAHGRDVAAVQVAAMVPSLAAVRAEGCAASPGLLYGDRRGVDRRADGGVGGGAAGDQGELLGFLRWLAAEVPDAAGYWPAQAVANHALAGVAAIDELTAMAAIPLYGAGGWDAQLAAAALVGGGTIDALGEQLVAGADEVGDVLVILGATLITWAVTDEWVEADGVWTIPHTTPGRVLVGGPSTAGGMFVDRLRRSSGRSPGPPARWTRASSTRSTRATCRCGCRTCGVSAARCTGATCGPSCTTPACTTTRCTWPAPGSRPPRSWSATCSTVRVVPVSPRAGSWRPVAACAHATGCRPSRT